MDFCQTLIVAITTTVIASIISVIGWFVLDHQNRKIRKEDAQRATYDRILARTDDLSESLFNLVLIINNNTNEISAIIKEAQGIPQNEKEKRKELLDKWYRLVTSIIDSIGPVHTKIKSYIRFLEVGGIDFGSQIGIYQGLKTVSFDTERTLLNIIDRWVNYIRFDSTDETPLQKATTDTNTDVLQISELSDCLDDVLVHLHNNYIAKPLNLKKCEPKNTQGRRYLSENGLIDNRGFGNTHINS